MRTVYWVGLQHVDCSLLLSWQSDFMRLLHSYCLSATDLVLFSFLEMSPEPTARWPSAAWFTQQFFFCEGNQVEKRSQIYTVLYVC